MKAIERLYQYFELKNIKPTRFEKEFGLSNGYFSVQMKRQADLGSSIIEIIINNCRDLNLTWLITGVGNMLNESVLTNEASKENITVNHPNNELLTHLKEQIKEKDQQIIDLAGKVAVLKNENEKLTNELSQNKKLDPLALEPIKMK
jgi:hypothetical protein